MKLLSILLLPGLLSAADILPGTHVLLRMMNSITTRTADEGTTVYLRTATPISVNGQIVAPEGCYVQGVVSHVRRPGKVKGVGELGIHLQTLQLPGGKVLSFTPRLNSLDAAGTGQKVDKEGTAKQSAERGKDAVQIAKTAGGGAAIGGIADQSWKGAGIGAGVGGAVGVASALLSRGHDVELRQGSTIDVVFDHPVALD